MLISWKSCLRNSINTTILFIYVLFLFSDKINLMSDNKNKAGNV